MNANVKKWVAALRSGKFKQGQGQLRQRDYYCCLGVACWLAVEAGAIPEPTAPDVRTSYKYQEEYYNLTKDVRAWLGGIDRVFEDELVRMNDRDSATFAEIANKIEGALDNEY